MDALALAVAAALLIVGAAAFAVRRRRIGAGTIAVGACLALMAYSHDLGAPAGLALLALMLCPLLAPVAAWSFLASRTSVRVALIAGLVAGPISTLLYDPFYDIGCTSLCDRNPLALVHINAAMHATLQAAAMVSAGALLVRSFRGPGRLAMVLLSAAAALSASSLYSADPARGLVSGILSGAVLLVVGGGVVGATFEARARVADLTHALESAADVEATLQSTVGDPSITVSYVLDGCAAAADRPGRPVTTPADGRVWTDIIGPEGLVARVRHVPRRADPAALAAAVTGPARLAFENGRLQAIAAHHARALSASRRRIVARADAERRVLERDLHDGAQQHLLALGLVLRGCIDAAADHSTQDTLQAGLTATFVALHELRDLAHGFYPASLDQTGLRDALDSLADRSPVPLSVAVPDQRLPAGVERAIYLLVARATETARLPVDVTVSTSGQQVDVVVTGTSMPDGVLLDVFAVLDGTLQCVPSPTPSLAGVLTGCLPLHPSARVESS